MKFSIKKTVSSVIWTIFTVTSFVNPMLLDVKLLEVNPMQIDIQLAISTYEECPICLELFSDKVVPLQFNCGVDHDGYNLPHSFCSSCVIGSTKEKKECPLCRKELVLFDPGVSEQNIHFQVSPTVYKKKGIRQQIQELKSKIPISKHICKRNLEDIPLSFRRRFIATLLGEARGEIKVYKTLNKSFNKIASAVFSADGERVFTISENGTACLWDVIHEKILGELENSNISCALFSDDRKTLITGSSDGLICIWNSDEKLVLVTSSREYQCGISLIAFFPSDKGTLVLTCFWDGVMSLWDISAKKFVKVLLGNDEMISSITFSSNRKKFLTGSVEGTVGIWDTEHKTLIKKLKGPRSAISAIVFCPEEKTFYTGSCDGKICLWNEETETPLKVIELKGHSDLISSIAFGPEGKTVLTGSLDKTARLWDIITGLEVTQLDGINEIIELVAFSPDGKLLFTGLRDSFALLWNFTVPEDNTSSIDDYLDKDTNELPCCIQ
ncbi:hypothetical protein H0X06_00845 [Candidatus Dependentiae bacterium]|nr:hypothetical protein [Candidatus Dependentiae bacterium]